MPRGAIALASGAALEAGVLGLAGSLLLAKALVPVFAGLTVSALALFFSQVVFMLRHRRPPPAERRDPDGPLVHVLQALAYLALSAALGLVLALLTPSEASLRLAFVYGVCGLLGFLAQLVCGVEARLVPMAAWIRGYADGGYGALPPSVHAAAGARLGWITVALWTLAVPALAAGLAQGWPAATSAGAGALALAVAIAAGSLARAWWRLRGTGAATAGSVRSAAP
jgi:hypothetical protein